MRVIHHLWRGDFDVDVSDSGRPVSAYNMVAGRFHTIQEAFLPLFLLCCFLFVGLQQSGLPVT